MSQPGFFLCNRAGGAVAKMPGYMENALELLDKSPASGTSIARPYPVLSAGPGKDMSKAEVIAPRLETLAAVKGHTNPFRGPDLHPRHLAPAEHALAHPEVQANFLQPPDNSYFRPEHEKGWVPVNAEQVKSPANVVVDAGHGIRFERCTLRPWAGQGWTCRMGKGQRRLRLPLRRHLRPTASKWATSQENHHPSKPNRIVKDNRIINNVITRTGTSTPPEIGVFIGYTKGTVIAHNEIFDVSYSGISIGWGWGMTDAGGGAYVCPVIYQNADGRQEQPHRVQPHSQDDVRDRNDGGGRVRSLAASRARSFTATTSTTAAPEAFRRRLSRRRQ